MCFQTWMISLRIISLGTIAIAAPAVASVQPASPTSRAIAGQSVQRAWKAPLKFSEFSEVPHSAAVGRCEETQPPQAIATPVPLVGPATPGGEVKVSFIVGTDGRVHSPLILKSAGPIGDRNVLQTVRAWRYRPATCNGVPTESEGRIRFSRH